MIDIQELEDAAVEYSKMYSFKKEGKTIPNQFQRTAKAGFIAGAKWLIKAVTQSNAKL